MWFAEGNLPFPRVIFSPGGLSQREKAVWALTESPGPSHYSARGMGIAAAGCLAPRNMFPPIILYAPHESACTMPWCGISVRSMRHVWNVYIPLVCAHAQIYIPYACLCAIPRALCLVSCIAKRKTQKGRSLPPHTHTPHHTGDRSWMLLWLGNPMLHAATMMQCAGCCFCCCFCFWSCFCFCVCATRAAAGSWKWPAYKTKKTHNSGLSQKHSRSYNYGAARQGRLLGVICIAPGGGK